MSFIFKCPHCNAMLEQEDEWENLDSQCAVCGKDIHIVRQDKKVAAPPPGMSESAKIVLALILLVIFGGGFAVYHFRAEIGDKLGIKGQEEIEAERKAKEDNLKKIEEAAAAAKQEALAKAEAEAAAKAKAEEARQQAKNQAISKIIDTSRAEAEERAKKAEEKQKKT